MRFYITDREAREILISVLAISFALMVAVAGLGVLGHPSDAAVLMAFFIVTVGVGFIFHELAHKFVANFFGAAAEFRMWVQGLVFMLFISLLGFVFAAPGAVYIYSPHLTRRENGIISVAGPLTNLVLALVFFAVALLSPVYFLGMNAWYWGAKINIFLGLFNMIPIYPLDGSKVFAWNIFAWGIVAAVLLGMFVFL